MDKAESPETKPSWHAVEPKRAAERLETHLSTGLAPAEAEARLTRCGRNALPEERKRTLLGMFLDQFKDFLVLILLGATAVSLVMREVTDALVIIVILIVNALLGVTQQRKAGRALEALKKLTVPECEVIRGGRTAKVSSEALVPGDLVILREGAFVPADLRLAESHNLRVDESSLTGESEPVEKQVAPVAEDLTLADRTDMAYSGTVVTYGRGRGLVVATGLEREIGRIALLLEGQEPEATPLQQKLAGFGKLLGVLILVICLLIFLLGIWQGLEVRGMFMTAVSLAVAAIPEGLPAIVTVVLALGVYRMSRRHAIVRRLPAVETLGCATYICTDKTGTLTENRMAVVRAITSDELADLAPPSSTGGPGSAQGCAGAGQAASGTHQGAAAAQARLRQGEAPLRRGEARRQLLEVAVLASDAHIERAGSEIRRFGDPTELALVDFAEAEGLGVADLRGAHPRLAEVPFDSGRKRMSTLHDLAAGRRLLVKGAPDLLLAHCAFLEVGGRAVPLGDADRQRAHEAIEAMAGQALRVLAFAYRDAAGRERIAAEDEKDLVLVGLVGMRDAPRAEAKAALQEAADAGIQTIMITGDNLLTARTIAQELGMMKPGDEAVSGRDLEAIPDDELARRIRRIRVFARVWPEQKLKIVKALQADGEVVAMTGDGVNDAPALQQADIGVAMGVAGTDVAKAAADVVLADDNFATIVKAIEEGRVIFDNIRKFVTYLLACNLGAVICIPLAVVWRGVSPLLPIQILLINLVTNGLPALALGVDATEPGVMRRPPRPFHEGVLTSHCLSIIVFNAVFIAAAVLAAFEIGCRLNGPGAGRTMAFLTLCLDGLLRAYSFRSRRRNFWQIDPRTNLYVLGAIAVSGGIAAVTILVSPLAGIFGNVPLTYTEWAIVMALSLAPVSAYEVWKVVYRRMRRPD